MIMEIFQHDVRKLKSYLQTTTSPTQMASFCRKLLQKIIDTHLQVNSDENGFQSGPIPVFKFHLGCHSYCRVSVTSRTAGLIRRSRSSCERNDTFVGD